MQIIRGFLIITLGGIWFFLTIPIWFPCFVVMMFYIAGGGSLWSGPAWWEKIPCFGFEFMSWLLKDSDEYGEPW